MDAVADGSRELRSALALAAVDGLGPRRLGPLLQRYGGPAKLLDAARGWPDPPRAGGGGTRAEEDPEDRPLRERLLRPAEIRTLRRLRPVEPAAVRSLHGQGVRVRWWGGPGYPLPLGDLPDPPVVLYATGPWKLAAGPRVAVVGTRRATDYGRRAARDLGSALAAAGCSVVSGMARGVDAEAHRGALDAGGGTVGILGSGLEHEYPASNRALYRRMRRDGALVTEFPPSLPPAPGLFPRRNRIIAALAEVIVVVQAGGRSGALITADLGLDLGREVFAVPGPVGAPGSVGVHRLLRDGAGLAASPDDVLAAVEAVPARVPPPGSADEGGEGAGGSGGSGAGAQDRGGEDPELVWRHVEAGVEHADRIAAATGLPPGRVLAALTELELAGRVRALPGDRFQPLDTPSRRANAP